MRLIALSFVTLFLFVASYQGSAQNSLFWVGGSGDWNDPANWSFTSGGLGGINPPNLQENAVFDENSFDAPNQTVTATGNPIFCRNMDWSRATNNPIFDVTDPNIDVNIGGSVMLLSVAEMTWSVQRPVFFGGNTTGHTIETRGQFFRSDVIFNAIGGGEWTLLDPFVVVNTLEFQAGTFITNGETVIANSFRSDLQTDNVTIDLGGSTVQLLETNAIPGSLLLNAGSLNLMADNSIFVLTGDNATALLRGDVEYSIGEIRFVNDGVLDTELQGGTPGPFLTDLIFENNGLILGNNFINTLTIGNRFTTQLENGSTQFIDDIATIGPGCDGDARLTSQFNQEPKANLNVGFTISLNAPVFYTGINFVAQSTVTLNGGVDGGNNTGPYTTFSPDARMLYWVGVNGDWNDPANWSETSGGMGGACIPRGIDNVVFDDNSFPPNGTPVTISNDLPIYVNSFRYDYSGNTAVILSLPELHIIAEQNNQKPVISGLIISEPLIFNVQDVFIVGTNQGGNTMNTDNQNIEVIPNVLNNLFITGSSNDQINPPRVTLRADLEIKGTLELNGLVRLRTNEFNVTAPFIRIVSSDVELELINSIITLTGEYDGVTYPLTITEVGPITSSNTDWIFTAEESGFDITGRPILERVVFNSSSGNANLLSRDEVRIGYLDIFNNGNFGGQQFLIDSLIFNPGRTYILNSDVDVQIFEYFQGLGDICSPIVFTTTGTRESLTMDPAIELNLSYMNIGNIAATGGGTDYFAGPGSEGSNASNWRFPTAEENRIAREFLGEDIVACSDEMIILSPSQNISISQIQWLVDDQDASMLPTFDPGIFNGEIKAVVTTTSGCTIADSINVNITQEFTYDLGGPFDVCQGSTLELRDPGFVNLGANFLWSTGEQDPSINVSMSNTYRVTVTRGNCMVEDEAEVTRIELEEFAFAQDTIRLCSGETEILNAPNFVRNTTSFTWSNGTSTPTLSVDESNLPADGYILIQVSEGSCSDSDSVRFIFDPEILQILPNDMDTVLCEGESFIQTTVPSNFDSVIWNTGANSLSIPIDANDITMPVIFTAEAFRGACRETASRGVRVAEVDKPPLGGDITLCANEGILPLTKPSSVNLPIQWYDINETALSTDDTLNIDVIIGTTTYILEVQDGICRDRDSIDITYEEVPDIFLGEDTLICQNQTLTLDLPQGLDDWMWSNGESSLTNTISVSDTIIATADRGRCSVADTIAITVLDLTSLEIGPPDTVLCEGDPLILDASVAGATNYTWFPANNFATFEVTQSNEYRVTVSGEGCEVSDTITVRFDPAVPPFDLHQMTEKPDTILCRGEEILYNFNIVGASYQWRDFDENELSTSSSFQINDEGSFILDVSVGQCTARDSLMVSIRELPEVDLQDVIFSCQGTVETLSVMSGNDSYLWSTQEDTESIQVTTDGLYKVTVTQNRCANSDSTLVSFQPLPNADLLDNTSICDRDSIILEFTEISVDYSWETPQGTSKEMMIVARTAGEYRVLVTDGNGCENRDTFNLTVNATPFFDWPDTTAFCDGIVFDLEIPNLTDSTRIRWFNGDQNPSIPIRDTGPVYADTFIGQPGNECTWSDTTYIRTRPIPEVVFADQNPTICSDSVLILDPSVPGAAYTWSTGENSETIGVSDAGTYTVTVNLAGCEDDGSITVATIQAPEVFIGADTTICENSMITLSINDPSWNAVWSNGSTTPFITVPGGETYSVVVEDNGCFDSADRMVGEAPLPVFELGDEISICDEIGTLLTVEVPDVMVEWNTTDIGSQISVTEAGTYTATATSSFGCVFVDDVLVTSRECVRFEIFPPNIFSPASAANPENMVFRVAPPPTAIIQDYEIHIYNRWGNLMYTSRDMNAGWDGRSGGPGTDLASAGVYTYVIRITYTDDFDTDRTDYIRGDVTLIR